MSVGRPAGRNNSFDLLRLILASAVIIGHAPLMIDGDYRREPAIMLFHTLSLGELAVTGFFAISGFLITTSWVSDPDTRRYAAHRFLRIVPAFSVAFLISVFIVGPLSGATLYWSHLPPMLVFNFLTLGAPDGVHGVFPGHPGPLLNGPLWTIQWEGICYLAAPGAVLLFRSRPRVFFAIGGFLIALAVLLPQITADNAALGHHPVVNRPLLAFWGGAACVLMKVRPRFNWAVAVALAGTLLVPALASVGAALLGGWALLGLGLARPIWKPPVDISYGVYLYGWPVSKLLNWWGLSDPWTLAICSLPLAGLLGFASYKLIEGPALRLRPRRSAELSFS